MDDPILFFYGAGVLQLLLAVPLILGKVGRNDVIGFRTAKALSSDAAWFAVNRFFGWTLAMAGAASLVLLTFLRVTEGPEPDHTKVIVGAFGGPIVLSVVASHIYEYQLGREEDSVDGSTGALDGESTDPTP